jgi:NADP-dependent alcohol dehydrogenase
VVTLPATGSEMNCSAVISRKSTEEKLFFGSPCVFPVFSVLDPEVTRSLPAKQVRNGVVDAYVHVVEQYVTAPCAAPVQDRFAESLLRTLLEVGPRTLAHPEDYDARASFVWSATLALNGLIGAGVPQDWATHMIGHELTAFYGLAHAESLAVVLPGVWRHCFAAKKAKLAQYGERVFGDPDPEKAVSRTEDFFRSLEMPTRLKDYKVDAEDAARRVSARFIQRGTKLGEREDLDGHAVAAILRSRA